MHTVTRTNIQRLTEEAFGERRRGSRRVVNHYRREHQIVRGVHVDTDGKGDSDEENSGYEAPDAEQLRAEYDRTEGAYNDVDKIDTDSDAYDTDSD